MSQLLLSSSFNIGYSALTNGALQSMNGDYVLAGRLFDETLNSSAFLLRTTPGGTLKWQKTYSSSFSQFFQSITQIADGNFIATGSYFYSELAGDEYLWVVKINEIGEKIWEKAFGSKNSQNDGYDVAATSDGGFVVTGLILNKEINKEFTWVLKFDSDGNLEWNKKFAGGVAYSIKQTKDNGYILSGTHPSANSLNSNVYILRLDPDGDKIWDRVYSDFEVYVLLDSDITETENGHFIAVAKSVIMEIGPCGNMIWGHQNEAYNLDTVIQTKDGDYGIGGSLIVNNYDHAYAAVIDKHGEKILWDNTELLYPSGIAQIFMNKDGYVTGGGYGPFNNNRDLVLLMIFSPVGNL